MLDELVAAKSLVIRQVKEWSEILVGYEARNRYEVRDEAGREVAQVIEVGSGLGRWLGRQFLGRCRKATLHVLEPGGGEIARMEKPFRWWFQEIELHQDGRFAGRIVRRFALLADRFALLSAEGAELLAIERGFLDHFRFRGTFRVRIGGLEVAHITKEWRGLFGEWFTDADTFGIRYLGDDLDPAVRKLLLAATFLIDFTCFENNRRGGGWIDVLDPGA